MRRAAYIALVGFVAGTAVYLLSAVGVVLNEILPLYVWGAMILIGLIVATVIDFLGPSPE